MRNKKRIVGFLLVAALLSTSTGCSREQQEVTTKDMDSDAAAVSSMEEQLNVMAKHWDQWLEREDRKKPYLTYAVTDLDRNGRWELIVSSDKQGSGRFTYTDYYQVNAAGDGLEKLATGYQEGDSQVDVVHNLETAYFDPEKKEYHYITGDFATAGAATGYYNSIEALSLRGNELQLTTLGYENREKNAKGKLASKYYKTFSGKDTKINKEEFSKDLLGDAYYPDCGKLDTHIAWFQFENSLKKVEEDNLLYYLRRSAKAFTLSDPIVQKEETIRGFAVKVPQYIQMTDEKKQERINKLIVKEAGKILDNVDKETFRLASFTCSVKLNNGNNLSILAESDGMGEGAPHPLAWADTINIDCERECVLAQTDLLPKDEREWAEEDIMEHDCVDIRDIGYRAFRKEHGDGKLLESKSDWEQVEVYQTKEKLGVVIPTIHAIGEYQIYEIRKRDDLSQGIPYDQIDWDAYRYKLPDDDYKTLQEYRPVLDGKKSFSWCEERIGEGKSTKSVEVTLPEFFEKFNTDAEMKDITFLLDYIQFCDVTQDGSKELVLAFDTYGYFFLILHKENDSFHGIDFAVRCFQGLSKNGVYGSHGGQSRAYYQLRFADGAFTQTYLGGYDSYKKLKFFIKDKEVTEETFLKWEKKNARDDVPSYRPFAKTLEPSTSSTGRKTKQDSN